MKEKSYTTFQIARICDVYPSTIITWIKKNKLRAYTTPGGHRRVLKGDLVEFMKRFNLPMTDDLLREHGRVLIVEDDLVVGRLLEKALKRASPALDVEWIQDGVAALLVLANNPPDILVLDVVLPVVDGASVLASLRSSPQTHAVKVVGITGKRLPPDKLRYMRRHTEAFFFKPFDLNEFVRKVLGLLKVPAETAPR
jgi:excisionase family DNA binding protein